jgi:hypothetical protein
LDLDAYHKALRFTFEHPLTAEPLRVDAVIIKKTGIEIANALGRIFRQVNLLEYKSPDDTLTIWDFYQGGSYTYQYAVQNRVHITEMTLSFVVSRYPRELLKQLQEVLGCKISWQYEGIASISGEKIPIPTQIVVSSRLPEDEHLWLKHLSNKLDRAGMEKMITASRAKAKNAYMGTYMHQLFLAHSAVMKEIMAMKRVSLEQVLEEAGLTTKWRAEGKLEGKLEGKQEGKLEGKLERSLEIAKNLIPLGLSVEQIAEVTKLDLDKVRELCTEGTKGRNRAHRSKSKV